MSETPLISIITINYNNCCGLLHTIKSVCKVYGNDAEYIVVDGGSNDGSDVVIEHHAQLVDHWISEPDRGIYDAMNKGVAAARGAFVIFMNSGDAFHDADALKALAPRAEGRGVTGKLRGDDIVYGAVVDDATDRPWPFNDALWKGMAFSHQSACIRTALLREHPYRTDLKIASDYEFFVWAETTGKRFRKVDATVARIDVSGVSFDAFEARTLERAYICKEHYRSADVQRHYIELLTARGFTPPGDIGLDDAPGGAARAATPS